MSTFIEEQLTAGMHDQVAGIRLTTDVLGAATRQHQRRVAVRRRAYAAGILGLAGALVAGAAIGGAREPGPSSSRPPVASAESANLQLSAAITASERISYKLKITIGWSDVEPGLGTAVMTGAFDPATSTGYLNTSQPNNPVVYYQRLINGKIYFSSSGQKGWKQQPGNGNFEYGDAFGGATGSTVDPGELFKALRQAGAKIMATGAGRYHFEVALDAGPRGLASDVLVGDVTLNADKRIAKVSYRETAQGGKDGQAFTSTTGLTIEFSDYGMAVKVEKPTNVIVAK